MGYIKYDKWKQNSIQEIYEVFTKTICQSQKNHELNCYFIVKKNLSLIEPCFDILVSKLHKKHLRSWYLLKKSHSPIKSIIFYRMDTWRDQNQSRYFCASIKTLNCSNSCKIYQFSKKILSISKLNIEFCVIIEFQFAKNWQNYNSRKILKPVEVHWTLFSLLFGLKKIWPLFQGVYFQQI